VGSSDDPTGHSFLSGLLTQLHFHQALPQPFDPPLPPLIGDGCAVEGSPVKTSRLGDSAPSLVICAWVAAVKSDEATLAGLSSG
jgi:hypothetical protein